MRGKAVVHVGRERPVRPLGHEALLVEEGQDAGGLRFDKDDAARIKKTRTKKVPTHKTQQKTKNKKACINNYINTGGP